MHLRPRTEPPRTDTSPRARDCSPRSRMRSPVPCLSLRGAREDDVAVVVQPEAWVVRDLPRMPVEIAESTGVPSVEGVFGLARDRGSVLASLLDHLVYLLPRTHVVSQGDAAKARTVIGDAHLRAELLPPPQGEDDAVALIEGGLFHLERRRPAKGLVERLRSGVVRDTESHEGYAL